MSARICMWSGPRNLSTAMMRSFGSRPDCSVWDEPFFAPFLSVSGKAHPGRAETLAAHETDPQKVAGACAAPRPSGYFFQKHMPHHMLSGFPMAWARGAKHFFLIRHPARVIASYAQGRAEFDLSDLGFAAQRSLHAQLTDMTGTPPPIVDCDDILRGPEQALKTLCAALDIPFDASMLSWRSGPRDTDGAWAPYWYASAQRSEGFGPAPPHYPPVRPEHDALYTAALADYNVFYRLRLQSA